MIAAYTTASVVPEITLTYDELPRGVSWARLTHPIAAPWPAWSIGDKLDVSITERERTFATKIAITSIERVGRQYEVRGNSLASPHHATIWNSRNDS